MSEIVIIRPGATDFDEQKRIQGALDLPLNARGQQQIHQIIEQLRGMPIYCVYTGPCEPARSTAAAICEEFDLPLKEVEEFRNLDCGLWQGLQMEEVRRKYPKAFKQWQECPENVCPPEGETVADAMRRIDKALRKCVKRKKLPAIVTQDPLATLIRAVLSGCKPLVCQSASPTQSCLIERLVLPENAPRSESLFSRALHLGGNGRGSQSAPPANHVLGNSGSVASNGHHPNGSNESAPATDAVPAPFTSPAWPGLAQ